jgi:excisionase family DNA binding protein
MLTPQELRQIEAIVDKAVRKALEVKNEQILNTKQVAEIYHTTTGAIYQLIHTNSIPHHKRGDKLYFSKRELDEYFTREG